jgi:hypothetical protein
VHPCGGSNYPTDKVSIRWCIGLSIRNKYNAGKWTTGRSSEHFFKRGRDPRPPTVGLAAFYYWAETSRRRLICRFWNWWFIKSGFIFDPLKIEDTFTESKPDDLAGLARVSPRRTRFRQDAL